MLLAGESRSVGFEEVLGVVKTGFGVTILGFIRVCCVLGLCGISGVELWFECLAGVWIVTS